MIREQLITFKTAKLAKEKGFILENPSNDYVKMWVKEEDEDETLSEQQEEDVERSHFYLALTQTILQRWLREVMGIEVEPYLLRMFSNERELTQKKEDMSYEFKIMRDGILIQYLTEPCDSYEKAFEAGLIEALKLIKL